ncbi:DUF5681 domain-containing protein [Ovoidimarina sediminis]|uniref:DUF5681 domain-containing protein n=1 Tax=Ovoidimarina sediminis TaxID=3079856 RepID=UPI0029159B8F|nr:DUF5681 domain-containing protein [Rhodophyticola sp. MJ-SS7]MDU8945991.1 DUF5681 domain-containing protein [Rhodophyticola sp. MJ-SS7]
MADDVNDTRTGRGRPPPASQFRKGKSGNPKGRPKGRQNMKTIVEKVAHETHWISEGGRQTELKTYELIFRRLQARAVSGDLEAKKLLDSYRERYQPGDGPRKLRSPICPPPMDLETWLVHAEATRKRMLWAQAERE